MNQKPVQPNAIDSDQYVSDRYNEMLTQIVGKEKSKFYHPVPVRMPFYPGMIFWNLPVAVQPYQAQLTMNSTNNPLGAIPASKSVSIGTGKSGFKTVESIEEEKWLSDSKPKTSDELEKSDPKTLTVPESANETQLESKIMELLSKRYEKQAQIDAGIYHRSGPGRKRKYNWISTKDVRKLVDSFFENGFRKLNNNKYNTTRTDAWVTMFQRTIKKIAFFMLDKVSVKNKYKSNDLSEYIQAYTETFCIFSLIFLDGQDTQKLMVRFIEFISIYFPIQKVVFITKELHKEKAISDTEFTELETMIKIRDKTAKKVFKSFLNSNLCMKNVMLYAANVFQKNSDIMVDGKAKKWVEKILTNVQKLFREKTW